MYHSHNRKKLFSLILIIVSLAGCSENSSENSGLTYYRGGQLRNVFQNEIIPIHEQFLNETIALNIAIELFSSTPTISTLEVAQEQWVNTMLAWQRCELYNFGPISMSVVHNSINKWPIDEAKIEGYVSSIELIDGDFVANLGSNTKGLAAMEHFLFSRSLTNSEILTQFKAGNAGQQRMNYVSGLSSQILVKAKDLNEQWMDYQFEFEEGKERGIAGSQNQLTNAMISEIEKIAAVKLGIPQGITNSSANPQSVESYRSGLSLSNIKKNLVTIERLFTGEFAHTPFRVGYDEYLEELGLSQLVMEIQDQIQDCQVLADNILIPLDEAVVSQPAQVTALYNAMVKLLTLIKVDLGNAIGSTITFTDNDGD